MIDFEQFQDKFSESGQRVMKRAYDESRRRDHNQVAPEHVFIALADLERNFFNELMQSLNVDPQAVASSLENKLTAREYLGRGMRMSDGLRMLLKNALDRARQRGKRSIDATDLFYALFQDRGSSPVEILRRLGAEPDVVVDKITTRVRTREERE